MSNMVMRHTNGDGEKKACNAFKRVCRFAKNEDGGGHLMLEPERMDRLYELEAAQENNGTFGQGFDRHLKNELIVLYTDGAKNYENMVDERNKAKATEKVAKNKEAQTISDAPKFGTMENPLNGDFLKDYDSVEDITAVDLKVGDKKQSFEFTEGGKWKVFNEPAITKVESFNDFRGKKTHVEVTYEDGTTAEYLAHKPFDVFREKMSASDLAKESEVFPEMTSKEVGRELKAYHRLFKQDQSLEDEKMEEFIKLANHPNIDGFSTANLKFIADTLEDKNRTRYALLVDSVRERRRIEKDATSGIQNPMALTVDERTSDSLYNDALKVMTPQKLRAVKLHAQIYKKPEILRKNDLVDWDTVEGM